MTPDINQNETKSTQQGETATYVNTLENQGTYENAGTVELEAASAFATSSSIASSGWSVSVTHPVSGRVIHPSVINPQSVQYIPGPNTLPRVRLPTRVNAGWLDEEFDDNPTMSVYLDGEQLPIGELVDVEHNEGETILVGEGGPELRQRVEVEYTSSERPTAATNLVQNNTSYSVVDNTVAAPSEVVDAQDPSGETELDMNITLADTDPFVFTGGGIKPAVTCPSKEGYSEVTTTTGDLATAADYTGDAPADGSGTALRLTPGEDATYEFDVEHTIPADSVGVHIRQENSGGGSPGTEWYLNGDLLDTISSSTSTERLALTWNDMAESGFGSGGGYDGPDLSPADNPHTIEIQTSGGSGELDVDFVALADNRYSYNFDNTVTTAGDGSNYLDGPELHPPSVDAVFDEYASAFSITDGSVSVTITDTSGAQALALSNDYGASYDITGSNTSSISGAFSDAGPALNLKATLSRYSPSGERTVTPAFGYDAQRLDAYDLDATVEFESLLVDQEFDNSLDTVLGKVLGGKFGWKYSIENGTKTVTIDEPGSTTADRDPQITESQIRKKLKTHPTVVIKGSSTPVSGEEFTASTTFVNLTQDNILTGSEAVYDSSGTQYQRSIDYAMDYSAGQIKILSGGDMVDTNTYTIDYSHRISGSHTVSGATGETLVRSIPSVVSDRQAEQIAYVLAEVYPGVATPRYEGRIVVPRLDVGFDPLEGLALDELDLPSVATPLSIRGSPQLTPLGLTLNLGSAPELQGITSEIRQQVSSLSDRV